MDPDELIALNEQIAGMARAGLPLDQGLSSLATELGRGRLRRVMLDIADDLRRGQTLSDAVARRQTALPPYYSHLIEAGVRTGRLPDILATLTTYARSISATRAIIIDALFYPIVVMVFSLALISGLLFFVLPRFDEVFNSFQMRLPPLTQVVLAIGERPVSVFVAPVTIVVLLVIVTWLALRQTERGRRVWTLGIYMVPILGTLLRSARLAAFSELLAVLIDFEVPLPEAFQLAGESSADPIMAHEAAGIYVRLKGGATLAEAVRARGLLPEWVAWMAAAGEQRGSLSATLRQIAALYRRQVDSRAALLRTVFPAFMIVVTAGLLVSLFSFSVMLPMIKLLEGLSK